MVALSPTDQTDTLTHWLTLTQTPGVGLASIHRLLDSFADAGEILQAPSEQLRRCGLDLPAIQALRQPDPATIERDLAWSARDDNRIITCRDATYPPLLLEIPDPPPLLYVHGNIEVLRKMQLAMVGSRNPTPGGLRTATDFAEHLSRAGLVITSGLALGIDAASHTGALQADQPTIAVMGTGLDRVYPASHRQLAHRIAEQGALVSEFPIGTQPRPENFPRRNRIISGLSLGILVVEAAQRSGSLISARCAAEQGREVFAIPGSIHNPLARGCHILIRQGAKLVETAQDIVDELGALALAGTLQEVSDSDKDTDDTPKLDPEYARLLDAIGYDPVPVDVLVETCGLTPAEVSSMLLQLELRGFVASSPGGLYNRLK
ncbi:MAG: DNA-processing protein DprA [Gammaproteobacteria bacterium]|nr:MAG: DNA-processing protein DprA [Gammaproteobacteria bacterium]